MADNQLSTILAIFITALVGIVLLVALASDVWENTNAFPISGEVVDITTAREGYLADGNVNLTGWNNATTITLANDNVRSVTTVTLGNGTPLTQDVDWRFEDDTEGEINILNSTIMIGFAFDIEDDNCQNVTNWTYTHGDMYVEDSTSRTLLGLIPLFFVIGMVVFIAGYVLKRFGVF